MEQGVYRMIISHGLPGKLIRINRIAVVYESSLCFTQICGVNSGVNMYINMGVIMDVNMHVNMGANKCVNMGVHLSVKSG